MNLTPQILNLGDVDRSQTANFLKMKPIVLLRTFKSYQIDELLKKSSTGNFYENFQKSFKS